jgi:hypothetical protein
MDAPEIELFIHAYGANPRIVGAKLGETLRDVLIRIAVIDEGPSGALVFVGECEEALAEADGIENGADNHVPVDLALTIEVLELHRHRHVHIHRCRHVAVDVNFMGKTKHHRFSPATTVGTVAAWARKKFHLDSAAGADYVLQLCNSTDRPRPDKHLGELTSPEKCAVCFDLVKEVTPQG